MNRWLIGGMALALVCTTAKAQSLDDLNIQIHGYATQGFLYTTQNNILTTSSSNGSPAWTEAVVNVTAAFRASWRSLVFSGQATMPKSLDSEAAVVEFVAHTPGAIGYVNKTTAHEGVKVLVVR